MKSLIYFLAAIFTGSAGQALTVDCSPRTVSGLMRSVQILEHRVAAAETEAKIAEQKYSFIINGYVNDLLSNTVASPAVKEVEEAQKVFNRTIDPGAGARLASLYFTTLARILNDSPEKRVNTQTVFIQADAVNAAGEQWVDKIRTLEHLRERFKNAQGELESARLTCHLR